MQFKICLKVGFPQTAAFQKLLHYGSVLWGLSFKSILLQHWVPQTAAPSDLLLYHGLLSIGYNFSLGPALVKDIHGLQPPLDHIWSSWAPPQTAKWNLFCMVPHGLQRDSLLQCVPPHRLQWTSSPAPRVPLVLLHWLYCLQDCFSLIFSVLNAAILKKFFFSEICSHRGRNNITHCLYFGQCLILSGICWNWLLSNLGQLMYSSQRNHLCSSLPNTCSQNLATSAQYTFIHIL